MKPRIIHTNNRYRMVKGYLFWRQDWFSICSKHGLFNPHCGLCAKGHWQNHWNSLIGSAIYKLFPKLWLIWVNRFRL